MSDPKLKMAMEEIKRILVKYDIAAQITLVSPTHSEFLYHVLTSWSVVVWNEDSIRFKSKRADFKNKKEQNYKTNSTVHMLLQIRDIAGQTFMILDKIKTQLDKHMKIEHKPFQGFKPNKN